MITYISCGWGVAKAQIGDAYAVLDTTQTGMTPGADRLGPGAGELDPSASELAVRPLSYAAVHLSDSDRARDVSPETHDRATVPASGQPASGQPASARPAAADETPSRAELWRQKRYRKARNMEPPELSLAERVIGFVERNRSKVLPDRLVLDVPSVHFYGVKPVLGGISGGGASGGVFYEPTFVDGSRNYLHAQAVASLRRYWSTEVIGGLERGPWVGYGYARYRHRPEERFFGVGPSTDADDPAYYRLDEGLTGLLVGRELSDRVLVGGHSSYRFDRVGSGRAAGEPSILEAFSRTEAIGVEADASYWMTGAFIEFDSRDHDRDLTYGRRFSPTENAAGGISLEATRGMYVSASIAHHADVTDDQYSYTRLNVDAQQFVPLPHGMQRGLAFRQFLSVTHSGESQTLPVHRMETIGGSRTLRGFTSGRFRDWNVAVTTAEMRCRVWHRLDMALFADVAQVFRHTSEISFEDLDVGYGVGFRFRSSDGVVARFEVARSVEGFSTYLKFGSIL